MSETQPRPNDEQELRDFRKSRDDRNTWIVLLILLLLILLFFASPLSTSFLASLGAPVDPAIQLWGPLGVALVVFFAVLLPRFVSWLRITRRYRWTREQRQSLHVRLVNASVSGSVSNDATGSPAEAAQVAATRRRSQGIVVVVMVVVFAVIGILFASQPKSLEQFGSWITGIFQLPGQQTAIVNGTYQSHFAGQDLGNGVSQTEQTWTYTFTPDGRYTTTLEGFPQYSGTWEQHGTQLIIHIPSIDGMTAAYDAIGVVGDNADWFTVGDTRWDRVAQ